MCAALQHVAAAPPGAAPGAPPGAPPGAAAGAPPGAAPGAPPGAAAGIPPGAAPGAPDEARQGPPARPVLLRREVSAGHGARAVSRSVSLAADTLAFAACQTGHPGFGR